MAGIRIWRHAVYGTAAALIVLLVFGIPTALIPSGFYKRMIEVTVLDYLFLVVSSVLIGVYVGLWSYKRWKGSQTGKVVALGGGASAFFAVSCPVCNMLLVSLIGVSSVMTFIEPLRPVLGVIGIVLLGMAIHYLKRAQKLLV